MVKGEWAVKVDERIGRKRRRKKEENIDTSSSKSTAQLAFWFYYPDMHNPVVID